jgi:hypothetical protein
VGQAPGSPRAGARGAALKPVPPLCPDDPPGVLEWSDGTGPGLRDYRLWEAAAARALPAALGGAAHLCRRLFPFGSCTVVHEGKRIRHIHPSETGLERDYPIPSLRILELTLTQDPLIPLHRGNTLVLTLDGLSYEWTLHDPAELLGQLNTFLTRHDPDLILTDHGDTAIIPQLLRLARRVRVPLALDREPTPVTRRIVTEGRSFFTYGRRLYHPPDYPFYGRWHIDRAHSFVFQETGFDGLVELARLSKLPVQRVARASIGTILTSMQLALAVRNRVLIPWRKGEPERWKTAALLLAVDKGGLVFQPPIGAFEDVAELDFSAMYPSIMVVHNVSAETLFCPCCNHSVVPETGYPICRRRAGLIPSLLAPLLARRAFYQARLQQGGLDPDVARRYDACQRALKWIGVTCFGYLGYRNARFGRIESHEAVTAFGREQRLRAKEICEAHGYELLHALTDAVWIRQSGVTEAVLRTLCDAITAATGGHHPPGRPVPLGRLSRLQGAAGGVRGDPLFRRLLGWHHQGTGPGVPAP